MLDEMQTRAELYATIGYHDYEALDQSIVKTIIPEGMPQRPGGSRDTDWVSFKKRVPTNHNNRHSGGNDEATVLEAQPRF